MAILYGTTGEGETLPVLVDQFGNLLAKGIEGQPGTPGEPGPPGGSFPLPSDPYEGAFLGWLNNELAWIGTPPVPIPEGVFGPITAWDPGGLLTVEGAIPSSIKQGVYIYQCNADGSIYVEGWLNSRTWSKGVTGYLNPLPSSTAANIFDGDTSTGCNSSNINGSGIHFRPQVSVGGTIELYLRNGDIDNTQYSYSLDNASTWTNVTSVAGNGSWVSIGAKTITFDKGIIVRHITTAGSNVASLRGIKVSGDIMIDGGDYPDAQNLNYRVQSVQNQSIIGVKNIATDFTVGKYLRVPEQNVARWLYDGNLNKVITSTGIDISRLKGT